MSDKKITGLFIDVKNDAFRVVTIPKNGDEYRKLIGCQHFDIVSRRIGSHHWFYDIICDDDGLYNEPVKISAVDTLGRPMLVGNLFIVQFDGIDDNMSLGETDIKYISRLIYKSATRNYLVPYFMLHECEYK